MAQRRLSADGRAELEAKREQLQLAPCGCAAPAEWAVAALG